MKENLNMWSTDDDELTESEMNTYLDEHHSNIFVPADVKRGLAEGTGATPFQGQNDVLGDCIIPDSMHDNLIQCLYFYFSFMHVAYTGTNLSLRHTFPLQWGTLKLT